MGGFDILSADSGDAALASLAQNGSVDLVLTDITMPGMDGFHLAAKIQEQHPGMPVVFMTGYAGDDEMFPAGSKVFRKPFAVMALLEYVRQCFPERCRSAS